MKDFLKRIIKLSPIPLSKNHLYDKLTDKILKQELSIGHKNTIDVGCHKGEILDAILKYSPQGKHYGVEPIPDMYVKLKEKYSGNDNCEILNFAASYKAETTTFNHVISNPAYSGLIKRDYDRPDEQDAVIEVKTEQLDNLIPTDVRIDLIKIDVEGAELYVLNGAKRIISTFKPLVIFEHGLGASNHYGSTPDKLFKYFSAMEMKISTLQHYVKSRRSLDLSEFEDQYYQDKNYYFVAHSITKEVSV